MKFNTAKCGFNEVIIIEQAPPLRVEAVCTTKIGKPEEITIDITGNTNTDGTESVSATNCTWVNASGSIVEGQEGEFVPCMAPGETLVVPQGTVSRFVFLQL